MDRLDLEGSPRRETGGKHMMNRWRQVAAGLLLAVATTVIALGAVELLLRRCFWYSGSWFDPDPVLGWKLKKNARSVLNTPEFRITMTTNSRGWRDIERSLEKPPGSYRIALLGDSFVEATSVEMDDAFHRRLERILSDESRRETEVLNFGVGGYGTLQEYLVYGREARRYAPDLVLLGFCTANDLRNNSYALEAAYYQKPSHYHVSGRPFLVAGLRTRWQIRPSSHEGSGVLAGARWYSGTALYAAAYRAKESLRLRFLDEGIWLGVFYCDPPSAYEDAWETTRRILSRLRDEVETDGRKLVVFSVPSRGETVAGSGDESVDSEICLDFDGPSARLGTILEDLGVTYVNLLGPFREAARDEGLTLHHAKESHWNAAGHALASRHVANALIRIMKDQDAGS